jgi:hypothetical protein
VPQCEHEGCSRSTGKRRRRAPSSKFVIAAEPAARKRWDRGYGRRPRRLPAHFTNATAAMSPAAARFGTNVAAAVEASAPASQGSSRRLRRRINPSSVLRLSGRGRSRLAPLTFSARTPRIDGGARPQALPKSQMRLSVPGPADWRRSPPQAVSLAALVRAVGKAPAADGCATVRAKERPYA